MKVTFNNKDEAILINGRRFIVVLNRDQMVRRYQLAYSDTLKDIALPLNNRDFEISYGFSCEFPHKRYSNV